MNIIFREGLSRACNPMMVLLLQYSFPIFVFVGEFNRVGGYKLTKKKWNYELMKQFIKELEFELIDKEYKGIDEKITIKDNDGYFYYISLYNLIKGFKPCKFDKVNIYTKQNIILWLNLNNKKYKLLDYCYENKKHMLHLIDEQGYLYLTSMNIIFYHDNNVRFVSKMNPYTTHNIKLWCKLNNKSFELINDRYVDGNKKSLVWKCLVCGEEFNMNWGNISSNHGCPYCAGQKVGLSNCLATKRPELAKEWHPTKNGDLTPYDVTCGYDNKVWWQCKDNPKHEWFIQVKNRNTGTGCPYCAGKLPSDEYNLLVCNKELCEEWNYDKNDKNPEDYTPNSSKKVWWKCKKCKHEWPAIIKSRNSTEYGCPICNESKGEKQVNNYLINNKWIRISQEEFDTILYQNKYNKNYFIPQNTFKIR